MQRPGIFLRIDKEFAMKLLKNIAKYSLLPLPGILGIINPIEFGPFNSQVVVNLSVSYLAASTALLGNHAKSELEAWIVRTGITRIMPLDKYMEYLSEKSKEESPFKDRYDKLRKNLCFDEIRVDSKKEMCIDGFVDYAFDPTTNTGNIKFRVATNHSGYWRKMMHDIIEPYYDTISNLFQLAPAWNELKPRIVDIKRNGGEIIIAVEPTSYFYTFITHYCPDFKLPGRHTEKITLRKIIEPLLITSQGKLVNINEYKDIPVSAALGVNLLLITKDKYIAIPKRSKYVAIAPGLYGISVAGSIDWKTIYPEGELTVVFHQEISEKPELCPHDLKSLNIIPLGIARSAYLLGEPGIFAIGCTDKTVDEVRKQTKLGRYEENVDYEAIPMDTDIHICSRDSSKICDDLIQVFAKIFEFIKEKYDKVGVSLHILLILLAIVLSRYCNHNYMEINNDIININKIAMNRCIDC